MQLPVFLKRLRRRLLCLGLSAVLSLSLLAPAAPAAASGETGWGLAASLLSGIIAYRSGYDMMLDLGNNASAQLSSYWQDRLENGRDDNENDQKLINGVMQQLLTRGSYVIPADGLPFSWQLTDSQVFNASCNPTNYISINRGLLRGMNGQTDEIAMVLAHEMTHGLEHHSAKDYAKTMASYYALSLANMATGAVDWGKFNALVGFGVAKNITLPSEYAADKGGFYLMASAGFNPGGAPAAMARLDYYVKYQTQDPGEYAEQKDEHAEDYDDHPKTLLREQRLAQMLTEYSAGHVTVKDRKTVCIDGTPFITATFTSAEDDFDDTTENAYLLAGDLARLFHDESGIAGWSFGERNGRVVFEDARTPHLTDLASRGENAEKLRQLAAQAYAAEPSTGAREKLRQQEAAAHAALEELQRKFLEGRKKQVGRYAANSDCYADYGDTEKALWSADRALSQPSITDKDKSQTLSIKARSLALLGDYAQAYQLTDEAIALDAKNYSNYLNRAEISWIQGNCTQAAADAERAKKADQKSPYGWYFCGMLYDELGDTAQALQNYKEFHRLAPKAVNIPPEYLKEIDPAFLKKLEKARADKDKARYEAEKKQKQEQQKEQGNKEKADR